MEYSALVMMKAEGIVTLTSYRRHGAEGWPAAPVILRLGQMSPGVSFQKCLTGSRDGRGLQVDVDVGGSGRR